MPRRSSDAPVFTTYEVADVAGVSLANASRDLRLPSDFSPALLEEWIAKVEHEPLRLAVYERWERLGDTAGLDISH